LAAQIAYSCRRFGLRRFYLLEFASHGSQLADPVDLTNLILLNLGVGYGRAELEPLACRD